MKHFEFFLSQNFEKRILINIFKNDETKKIKDRAKQYKFPIKLAKDIKKLPINICENKIDNFLNISYKRDYKKMNISLKKFIDYWDNNENYYFDKLEKFFNKQIPLYEVLLSRYVAGISDWEGNHICTNIFSFKWKKYCNHNYCLLYEIVLSEIFKLIKIKNNQLKDNDIWIMSELSSFVILHKFFDEFSFIKKTYYNQIDCLINKVYLIYDNTNNINDFLENIMNIRINK